MATSKNYIKGTYANTRNTPFGEEINLDYTDDAIEHLKSLPKNEKGYRRLTISRQKDPAKWSVYENAFVPKNGNSSKDESSDLPF